MTPHTETGRIYIVALQHDPPFDEIHQMYVALGAATDALQVVSPRSLGDYFTNQSVLDDPRYHFVLWEMTRGPLPLNRKATISTVYFEAYGGDLLPEHVAHWKRFREWATGCDFVYCHTPEMCDWLSAEGLRTHLLPVGYHWAMGVPGDLPAVERRGFSYWGSRVGLRDTLVPAYQELLGTDFRDISGHYGEKRRETVERTFGQLYLPHSKVWSGSTWRLWQAVASSTPLISWETNLWPAEPHKHYLVPPSDDPATVVAWLRSLSWEQDLRPVALRAHAELRDVSPLNYLYLPDVAGKIA